MKKRFYAVLCMAAVAVLSGGCGMNGKNENITAGMEAVAGRGSCHVLSIRDTGSVLLVS